MTEKEVIDKILYKMEPGLNHGYLNLWQEVTKATLTDIRFAVMDDSIADKILKKMIRRSLVEVTYSGGHGIQQALIKLADRALKLREDETWVNNVKKGDLTEKKESFFSFKSILIWSFGVIGGVASMLIYDWIKEPNRPVNSSTQQQNLGVRTIQDSVKTDLKTKELVEAVLNFPAVIKFSKTELLLKEYGTISIYFNQDTIAKSMPTIFQNGRQLELLVNIDSIDREKRPCYVFTKISITNNEAYVNLILEMTGFVTHGKLNYIDGHWTPDKEFRIGYY